MSERKVYNKLVRDHIPEIIEANGGSCRWRRLTDAEYLTHVDQKLGEELAEYLEDGDLEELADLLEVLYAAAAARGCSREQLEALRQQKADQRGAFDKRVFLEDVSEG